MTAVLALPREERGVTPLASGTSTLAPAFLLDSAELHGLRLERAIGVIYRPETERISHYFHARISRQFDAVIHLDVTSALEPLERTSECEGGELPETYPFGV